MPDFSVTIHVSTGAAPADQYRELLRSAILTWANKKGAAVVIDDGDGTAARLEKLQTAIEAHMDKVEPALDRISEGYETLLSQRSGMFWAIDFSLALLEKHLGQDHPDVKQARAATLALHA